MTPIFRRRRSLVRQCERVDCGPAALLTVLRYWGGDTSLPEVRDLALTDARGTTLWGLKRAAEALGFVARGVRGTYDDLVVSHSFPCIAHLLLDDGTSHYVVVWASNASRVRLGDPASGKKVLNRVEFERLWRSRAALLLRPTGRLRSSPPGSWVGWIAGYFRDDHAWLVQSLFLGAAGTTLGLVTALSVQQLIDRFIPERDPRMIAITGALLFGLLALRTTVGYTRRRLLLALDHSVSTRMNQDLLDRLFRLPLRFFERRSTGELTVRLAEGVQVERAAMEVLSTGLMDGLIVLGSLVLLAYLAPPFALLAVATIPLYAVLLIPATTKLRADQTEAVSAYSRVESACVDSLSGINDIMSAAAGHAFARANALLFGRFQASVERLGRTQSRLAYLSELVGGGLILAALIWGALLTVQDALQMGQLVAGYSLLAGMLPSADRLVAAVGTFQEVSIVAHRVQDVLLAAPEPLDSGRTPVRVARELRLELGSVECPPGNLVLEGINLAVPCGRITAVSGPNGTGKTTLLRALARLLPLSAGTLLVDGMPATEFAVGEYRRRISLVAGNPRIFRGTLAENVLLGRPPERLDALAAEVEALGLQRVIGRFSEGWNTLLGEGGRRISAGERQVVGFLRALAANPQVLLVDEALGATDEVTSGTIMDAVDAYSSAHPVLMVSHDPRILTRTDYLYLLAGGAIRAEGDPAHLLPSMTAFSGGLP